MYSIIIYCIILSTNPLYSALLYFILLYSVLLYYATLFYDRRTVPWELEPETWLHEQLFTRPLQTERKKRVLFKACVRWVLKGTNEGYNEGHVIFCARTCLDWLEESSCRVTHRGLLYIYTIIMQHFTQVAISSKHYSTADARITSAMASSFILKVFKFVFKFN